MKADRLQDSPHWADFSQWFLNDYGYPPFDGLRHDKLIFFAYLAGRKAERASWGVNNDSETIKKSYKECPRCHKPTFTLRRNEELRCFSCGFSNEPTTCPSCNLFHNPEITRCAKPPSA